MQKYVICWRCITTAREGRNKTPMSHKLASKLAELLNMTVTLFDHWVEKVKE